MKKRLFLVLTVVVLLIAVICGIVYAQVEHQTVQGSKLVGTGKLGMEEWPGGNTKHWTTFRFTNPDCTENITITQISITRSAHRQAEVVYEGPHRYQRVDEYGNIIESRIVDRQIAPHEVWEIHLSRLIPDGSGWWLPEPEARKTGLYSYSVEISWEAPKETSPLIGWQVSELLIVGPDWHYRTSRESSMVNLEQVIQSSKPKK